MAAPWENDPIVGEEAAPWLNDPVMDGGNTADAAPWLSDPVVDGGGNVDRVDPVHAPDFKPRAEPDLHLPEKIEPVDRPSPIDQTGLERLDTSRNPFPKSSAIDQPQDDLSPLTPEQQAAFDRKVNRNYNLFTDLGIAAKEGAKELGHALPETTFDIATAGIQMAADAKRATDPTNRRRLNRNVEREVYARADEMRTLPEWQSKIEAWRRNGFSEDNVTEMLLQASRNEVEEIPLSSNEKLAQQWMDIAQGNAQWMGEKRGARAEERAEKYPDYFDPEKSFGQQPGVARAAVSAAPSVPGMALAVLNPMAGAVLMSAQETLPGYTDMRGKGISAIDAATRSSLSAIGTVALEKLPFDVSKILRKTKLAQRLGPELTAGMVLLATSQVESATEVLQEGYQWALAQDKDLSWDRFMEEVDLLEVWASSTLTMGGVQTPGAAREVFNGFMDRAAERTIAKAETEGKSSRKEWIQDESGKWLEVTVLTPDPALSGDREQVGGEQPSQNAPRRSSLPVVVPESGQWAASTPKGEAELSGEWQVVDAATLVTSDAEGYDQQLQPRNRSSISSAVQVDEIARNLNPNRLLDSSTTDDGAPIVDAKGQVISGNGRVMALRAAYDMGTAESYRDVVAAQAEAMGLDIGDMQTPVLVRSLPGDQANLEQIAEWSNQPKILERSAAEMAKADAELLSPELLSGLDPSKALDSKANESFFAGFVGATKDASLLKADGSIDSVAAKRRLGNAMVAALAADHPQAREVITTLTEQADALGLDKQLDALSLSAPALIRTGALKPAFDLRGRFGAALNELVQFSKTNAAAKANKQSQVSIEDWTRQQDLFTGRDPLVDELTRLVLELPPADLPKVLDRYSDLSNKVDLSTQDMFGVQPASALDLLQKAAAEIGEGVDSSVDFRVSEDASRPASEPRKAPVRASRTARANMEPAPMDRYLNPFSKVLRQAFGSKEVREVAGEFIGKPLINTRTGLEATVSNNSLNKMLNNKAVGKSVNPQVHMAAVANVDRLFERAETPNTRADRTGNPNIKQMHEFPSSFNVDGVNYRITILVKEFKNESDGNRIYTLDAVEIDEPASMSVASTSTNESPSQMSNQPAGSQDIIPDAEGAVNGAGSSTARADVGDISGPGWPGGAIQEPFRVKLAKPPADDADNPRTPLARWIGRPLQSGLDVVLEALGAQKGIVFDYALSTSAANPDIRVDVDPFSLEGRVNTRDEAWRESWERGEAAFEVADTSEAYLKAVRALSMPVDVFESNQEALQPLVKDWDMQVLENGRIQLMRPGHQRVMMEMPELLRFAEWMGDGKIPHIMKKFRNAGWLGVFRHGDGKGDRIELRADIFQLVTPAELSRLREKAAAYAQRTAQEDELDEKAQLRVADERYKYLVDQAKREARRNNPKLATKVLTHEIAHWVDHMPDKMINQRGNILGRLGHMTRYLKQSLNENPEGPHTISKQDRSYLRGQANKQVREAGFTPGTDEFKAEVSKRTQLLKARRMKESGMITREEVMEELRDFIAFWRGTDTMEQYFEDPAEMYAEAISGYLLNPAELGRRAPLTYGLIEAYIDKNSKIKKMWDKLQTDIMTGSAVEDTEKWLRDSFAEGDRVDSVLESAMKGNWVDALDKFLFVMDKKYGPIYRRAKQLTAEARGDLVERIADYRYRANKHEGFIRDVNRMVLQRLTDNNLGWEDLDVYMYYYRVIHEGADSVDRGRSNLANPGGVDVSRAEAGIKELKRKFGQERFNELEAARNALRGIYEQHVLTPLRKMEVLDPELMAYLESNEAYATFKTHRGEQDAFEQAINSRYGDGVGTGIYKQYGTFQKIHGPGSSTVKKGIRLIDMAYRNNAIRGMVEMLEPMFLDQIVEAEYKWDGKGMAPVMVDNDRRKTVMFLKNGELKGYHVPKTMADAWARGDDVTHVALRFLNKWINGIPKRVYTELSPGFWPVAFVRDVWAYKRNMPSNTKWGSAHLYRNLPRAFKAAFTQARGNANANAVKAAGRDLTISSGNYMGFASEEQSIRRVMKRYQQSPRESVKAAYEAEGFFKAAKMVVGKGWNAYTSAGQVLERTMKIAGMIYMDENFSQMPEYLRNQTIREFSGSPDFLESPSGLPVLDLAMMFYNPWKLGFQAELHAAIRSPARYIMQHTKFTVMPALLIAGMRSGALTPLLAMMMGDDDAEEFEKQFRSISIHDLMTGICIPFGWDNKDERTVKYIKLPLSEGQRVVSMMIWNRVLKDEQMNDGRSVLGNLMDVARFAGGDVPGKGPILDLWDIWKDYNLGLNPIDSQYNTPILTQTEFDAKGAPARNKLYKYSWNQIGGGLIGRFQLYEADREKTDFEKFINSPGISSMFGRIVKVSNRGLWDTLQPIDDEVKQERANERIEVSKAVSEGDLPPMNSSYQMDYADRVLRSEMERGFKPLEQRLLDRASSSEAEDRMRLKLREILD